MPWGRVDDRFYRHAKVAELDARRRKGCVSLYWLAVSWCNDELTDGRVPLGTVRLLGCSRPEAEELVRVGLWERDGTAAYRIHDFLQFNQSAAKVREIRVLRARVGKAGAERRWDGKPDGKPHGKPDANDDGKDDAPSRARGARAESPVSRLPLPVENGVVAMPKTVGMLGVVPGMTRRSGIESTADVLARLATGSSGDES